MEVRIFDLRCQTLSAAVYPAIYEIWKWHVEMMRARAEQQPAAVAV